MPPALFVADAGGVRATDLTRGPWAHQVMHGGAIGGLLGWAVEREQRRLGISQVCSRLTVEILSGMPMATYAVTAATVKAGKRTALVDAEVRAMSGAGGAEAASGSVGSRRAADATAGRETGRLVARATSQWLTPTEPSAELGGDGQSLPPIPAERADPGANPDIDYPRPGFNADAVDFSLRRRLDGGAGPRPYVAAVGSSAHGRRGDVTAGAGCDAG